MGIKGKKKKDGVTGLLFIFSSESVVISYKLILVFFSLITNLKKHGMLP